MVTAALNTTSALKDFIKKYLEKRGYKTTEGVKVLGKSGAEHTFDMLARRDAGFASHSIGVALIPDGDEKTRINFLHNCANRAYDVGLAASVIIATTPLSQEAQRLAQHQRMKIVNADDIKIIGINVYNLDSGMETCPFVVSVLYNKREIWFFDSKTNKKETEFVKHPPIQKPSGNKVYLGLFDQADYQCIDGVLWFDYSLGTIIPEKCNVQFLANRGRKKKIDGLFSCWECVLYEDGWLIRQKLYPA